MIRTRSHDAAAVTAACFRRPAAESFDGPAAALRRASRFAMSMALVLLAVSGLMIGELESAGLWRVDLVRLGVGILVAACNLGIILISLMLAGQSPD